MFSPWRIHWHVFSDTTVIVIIVTSLYKLFGLHTNISYSLVFCLLIQDPWNYLLRILIVESILIQ
jgi:hypothetical protein